MEKVKEVMKVMGAIPKFRLGEKLLTGGVKSFGPKEVTFVAEPEGVTKNDHYGKPQKMLRFEVEHKGNRYYWYVPVLNKEGDAPNYLMERLADVKVGDVFILEMRKQGAKNYVDIREPGQAARIAEEDEGEEIIHWPDENDSEESKQQGLL